MVNITTKYIPSSCFPSSPSRARWRSRCPLAPTANNGWRNWPTALSLADRNGNGDRSIPPRRPGRAGDRRQRRGHRVGRILTETCRRPGSTSISQWSESVAAGQLRSCTASPFRWPKTKNHGRRVTYRVLSVRYRVRTPWTSVPAISIHLMKIPGYKVLNIQKHGSAHTVVRATR